MLLEELEAQSPNSDICDSETNSSDMSDNEYCKVNILIKKNVTTRN